MEMFDNLETVLNTVLLLSTVGYLEDGDMDSDEERELYVYLRSAGCH
jgi:hypothetical protein